MNQKKSAPIKVKGATGAAGQPAKRAEPISYAHTVREIIEQVIIALVLAFLFRTFEAEAFVIPTGSMAPTLQGRHKEIVCPECGYTYRVGASNEVEDELHQVQREHLTAAQLEERRRALEVVKTTCPMCRYIAPVDPETPQGAEYPSYGGDRILVGKFPYEFMEPQRWDVIVFKYPGDAKVNFIKRLVGLPGETLRIYHGDIFTQRGQDEFEIERKPPAKLRAMAQAVYDNDFVVDSMTQKGWPVRWQPWPASDARSAGPWKSADGSRSYETDGSAPTEAWIRYRHFVPTPENWRTLERGGFSPADAPMPQLITDDYAYNGSIQRFRGPTVAQGLHWVGDLMLESQLDIRSDKGLILLDLVKGGQHFRCDFDVATGQARLSIDGLADFHPAAQTAVKGPGTRRVLFSNVDRELRLWVDGSLVAFDAPTTYGPLDNEEPRSDAKDPGDLAPAGIGSQGAAVRVVHMRLLRDIYYIADRQDRPDATSGIWDYERVSVIPTLNPRELARFMSDPQDWQPQAPGQLSPFQQRREVSFPLAEDQFFAMGDNSPYSKDSRLWYPEHYVDRDLLIGKALFIYWPATHNRIPWTKKKIPFPYFPNFPAMGLVR